MKAERKSMNQLTQVFENHELRIIEQNGEPWFVAKDVAEILNYRMASDLTRRLDEDEKGTHFMQTPGGKQKINVINESGVYTAVFHSNKPEAKQFKRWITSEVIPSIRKHGAYMTPETIEQALLDPDTIIQLATNLKHEREKRQKLETDNLVLEQRVQEYEPKATYYDMVLQNKSLLSVSKIAKDFGLSAMALNKKLHELGVQYKQGDIWLLYAKYQDKGFTQTSTHVIDADKSKVTTKWTQKGRLFIYDLLKREEILPLIERDSVSQIS